MILDSVVGGKRWLAGFVLGLFVLSTIPLTAWAAGNVYYRYMNDQGVQVLDDSIPPQYAQKGYEIVSLSGAVIKVVPPAPEPEELARKEAMRKLHAEYQRLSRRYSSLADIKAAKQRKLDNLNTSITIVRSNIFGLKTQIENVMAKAADVERAGRQVPESLLQKLANIRAELAAAKALLQVRLVEYEDVAARFDADIVVYAQGSGQS